MLAVAAEAATTKYWVTRVVACTTYTDADFPRKSGNLTGSDALRAYFNQKTYGYCDVKLPDNFEIPYAEDEDDLRLWNIEIMYEVP